MHVKTRENPNQINSGPVCWLSWGIPDLTNKILAFKNRYTCCPV